MNLFHVLGLYGGNMLGVRSVSGLAFYDWDTTELVRRIEITPKNVSYFEARCVSRPALCVPSA